MNYTENVHFKTTKAQLDMIDGIAKDYGKSRAETIRDIINSFVLITDTEVTLKDVLVAVASTLADRLIETDPVAARAISGLGVTEPEK